MTRPTSSPQPRPVSPVSSVPVVSSAVVSGCGRYRYWLGRAWSTAPPVTFVMLNPSTADAHADDPTIRRCVNYARAWGYGGIWVVNLYAWRATDPRDLRTADDPVGPDNNAWLTWAARTTTPTTATAATTATTATGAPIVAAWGAHADPERVRTVLGLTGMHRLTALAFTKSGQPRHPLYLPGHLTPVPLCHHSTRPESGRPGSSRPATRRAS